jgi:hypothetical protein
MKYELYGGRFDGGEVEHDELPLGGILKIPVPPDDPPKLTKKFNPTESAFTILYYRHDSYARLTYMDSTHG